MKRLFALAIAATVIYVVVAFTLDLFTTYLLLAGMQLLWPNARGWVAMALAIFALAYPFPTLLLMIYPVKTAWERHGAATFLGATS